MMASLRVRWETRSPKERAVVSVLAMIVGIVLYAGFVQSADRARLQLNTAVTALRAQSIRLEQQAAEYERLRAAPAKSVSQTDLRALVQTQIDAAGLSRALVRIDAPDPNQVQVAFGAISFADWLGLLSRLQAQQVRLDACRIEALAAAGMVSVTGTLVRAKPL